MSSWQKPTNTDTQLVSAAESGEIPPILLGDKSQNLCIFWILWHGLYILLPVRVVFTFLMVSLKFNTRFLVLKIHKRMKLTRSSDIKQSPEAFHFLITEILDPCNVTLNFYVLSLWQLACTLPHFCGCLRFLMVESYAIWPSVADFILYHLVLKIVHVESPFLSTEYFIVCLYNTLYFVCVYMCAVLTHGGQRLLAGVALLLCGFQEWNSRCQAWWLLPLLLSQAENWPISYMFSLLSLSIHLACFHILVIVKNV